MSTSPTPVNFNKDGKRNMLPFGALGLSLLVHVAVLLMVGGAVLVQGIIPKESFLVSDAASSLDESMVLPEAPPEEVMEKPVVEQLTDLSQTSSQASDSADLSADVIIASSPNGSMNLMPVMSNAVSPLGNSLGAGMGTKGTRGSGSPTAKMVNLFGNPLESSSLGVVLDVSGSTHKLLLPVMEEIDKKYGNAKTVLAIGCGMSTKLTDVTVKPFQGSNPDPVKDKSGARTTLGQLVMAAGKNAELDKYIKKLKHREDVWYVQGGDIFATRFAFEKLIEEKVDTIFWFADFADAVAVSEAEELAKKLRSANIKVILFDFTGNATKPAPLILPQKTGGKAISQIIK